MLLAENIRLALNGLRSNMMRTLLTMLGIIIGISSVITIMTVSHSVTVDFSESMQEMGANNITLSLTQKRDEEDEPEDDFGFGGMFGMSFGDGGKRAMRQTDLITDEMLDGLREAYPEDVAYLAVSINGGSGTAIANDNAEKTAMVDVNAQNSDGMINEHLEMVAGRDFIDQDYSEGRRTCVVSDYLVEKLFKSNDEALGEKLEVEIGSSYYDYYIVGIYKYENSTFQSMYGVADVSTNMYIPYLTGKIVTHADDGYKQVTLVTTAGADVDKVIEHVDSYFNGFYESNDAYYVSINSLKSMLDELNTMLKSVSIALSVIAGISLLVGGIGVMNIMLVSITERTREIGTRKALGATNTSIRLQFITESIVICTIGGVVGIALGVLMAVGACKLLKYTVAVSSSSVLIAVGFSMAIGIFFGYYPANKAAKLNPIDALRYE